jgi:hypothetical protein
VLLAQHERLFHRDDRYPHTHRCPPDQGEDARIALTDLANPRNPLGQMQGYEQARKRLCHAACTALGRYNHVCNDVAFLLTGPKGDHKAVIARRFAELLRLPFIEMSAATVKTAHDLFIGISTGLQRAKLPLVECNGPAGYVLPPCVIFLDCDGLNSIVTAAVLQAVSDELNLDGSKASVIPPTLRTEQGVQVHTIQATWLLATTGRAELLDGLPVRFTELALSYSPQEQRAAATSQQATTKNIHCLNADWSCPCGVVNRVADGHWPENSLITCSSCQRQFEFPAEWRQTGRSYTTPPAPVPAKNETAEQPTGAYYATCPRCRQRVPLPVCPNCNANGLRFAVKVSWGREYRSDDLSCCYCKCLYEYFLCSCGCQIATSLFEAPEYFV